LRIKEKTNNKGQKFKINSGEQTTKEGERTELGKIKRTFPVHFFDVNILFDHRLGLVGGFNVLERMATLLNLFYHFVVCLSHGCLVVE
jgi:hypothetical protein